MKLPNECCANCKQWIKDNSTHGRCGLIELVHEDSSAAATSDPKRAYCNWSGEYSPEFFTGAAFCCNRFERAEQSGSTDEIKTECQPFDPYDL